MESEVIAHWNRDKNNYDFNFSPSELGFIRYALYKARLASCTENDLKAYTKLLEDMTNLSEQNSTGIDLGG